MLGNPVFGKAPVPAMTLNDNIPMLDIELQSYWINSSPLDSSLHQEDEIEESSLSSSASGAEKSSPSSFNYFPSILDRGQFINPYRSPIIMELFYNDRGIRRARLKPERKSNRIPTGLNSQLSRHLK